MLSTEVLHFEEKSVFDSTIADASVKVSFSDPLRLVTTHANGLFLVVLSNAVVTVFRRYYAASGRLVWDDAVGTVLVANTVTPIAGPTFALGQECEVLISNASGGPADITAWLCARS